MQLILMQLGMIFILALAGLLIAIRLKLPPTMGIIVIGFLISPNLLGLIEPNNEIINTFSSIGAIILLFIIGIEFSLSKLVQSGLKALMFAVVKISFVFLIMYALSLFFGLTIFESILLGVVFSFSSTILFSKLVEKYKHEYSEEIKTLYALLILEDIIAILALAILPNATSTIFSFDSLIISMANSLAMLLLFYVLFQFVVKYLFEYSAFHSTEVLLFTSLSVCAIFVFIATVLGFEASIGAFLAGSLMSSLKEFKNIEKIMLPFGLFFSSFFFLSIGMTVNLTAISGIMAIMILVFLMLSMIAKFFSVGIMSYVFGSNTQTAVFSGLSMITASEFSLIIASKMNPYVSFDIVSLLAVTVFASAIISAVSISNLKEISSFFERNVSFKMKGKLRNVSTYFKLTTKEFEPRGVMFELFVDRAKIIIAYVAVLILANGILLVLANFIDVLNFIPIVEMPAITLKALLQIVISSIIVFKIIESAEHIIDGFANTFSTVDRRHIESDRKIAYTSFITVSLICGAVLLPFASSLFGVSNMLVNILQVVLLGLAVFIVADIFLTAHTIVENSMVMRLKYSKNRNKNFILDMIKIPRI